MIWKAETPKVVPCGARISAGKSGKVARSLPASAVDKRELAAGQLHAVAAVAGKADDDRFHRRAVGRFLFGQQMGRSGHEDPESFAFAIFRPALSSLRA